MSCDAARSALLYRLSGDATRCTRFDFAKLAGFDKPILQAVQLRLPARACTVCAVAIGALPLDGSALLSRCCPATRWRVDLGGRQRSAFQTATQGGDVVIDQGRFVRLAVRSQRR
jgi:hypothetical protein